MESGRYLYTRICGNKRPESCYSKGVEGLKFEVCMLFFLPRIKTILCQNWPMLVASEQTDPSSPGMCFWHGQHVMIASVIHDRKNQVEFHNWYDFTEKLLQM